MGGHLGRFCLRLVGRSRHRCLSGDLMIQLGGRNHVSSLCCQGRGEVCRDGRQTGGDDRSLDCTGCGFGSCEGRGLRGSFLESFSGRIILLCGP